MKIVTIGGATQDIFITYSDPHMLRLYSKTTQREYLILEEGSKIEIDNLSYYTGGGATNSAVSFSRLGFDVSTIFKTGNDLQADLIIKKLKKEHVNITDVTKDKTLHTGTSIIIPSLTGDRTVLAYRGSNIGLEKKDINEGLIKNSDQLYITSLSGKSSKILPYITKLAKKYSTPVAINPGISQLATGSHELRESLKNIDIFILNSCEANKFMKTLSDIDKKLKKELSNTHAPEIKNAPELLRAPITYQDICFSLHNYFCQILQRGPKIVVVTNGKEGVYVATDNTIYYHPSIKTKIISTLGAGDSFGSCFVASLIMGKSIEESIVNGVINSSSVISYLDAKTGLLTKDKLEKTAKDLTTNNIEIFKLVK